MDSIEPAIYVLGILITVIWLYGIRTNTRTREGVAAGTVNTTLLFVVSLVLLPQMEFPAFHLLWAFPAALVIGLLHTAFPFSLVSIPGYILWRLVCIGIDTSDVTHRGIYGLSLTELHDHINKSLSKDNDVEPASTDSSSTNELDEIVHLTMKSLSKRVRALDSEKKKLIKMATIYGLAIALLDGGDVADYVTSMCKRYKIGAEDTTLFMNFYERCDGGHIVFNITNMAQEVAQSDNPEEMVNELLDVVDEIVNEPEFPESVMAL
ncbi:MAG: hypothetical protein K8I04_14525 [Gammaproteobacteria bacterium]|nr:hypothetical protein [Gammaproteobacteria bacterium]